MNILVTAYLLSAFICFESAITVYRLNSLSKLNRLYAALAASFALYSVIMIQFLLSPDEAACWFWYRVFVPIACIFVTIGVHYFLELTGIKAFSISRLFIAVLYAVPVLVALPAVTFLPILNGFIRIPGGWGIMIKETGWAVIVYTYLMVSVLACAFLAVRWRLTSAVLREKKQANVIILSGMIGAMGLMHLFFPAFHSNVTFAVFIHLYYVFCFILFVFSIRYAVKKYGLMTITSARHVYDLFEGMREALFIINTRGEIIYMNKNARIMARGPGNKSNIRNIFNLFAPGDVLNREIAEIVSGRDSMRSLVIAADGKTGRDALDTSLLGVKNEAGALIGLIVIARKAGEISGLQEEFLLSAREMEVLLLLCNGLSAQEIAQECDIAIQTAKSHIHNIYKKTGLKNRVELSNLLNKHL